jgi:hypothetical protein
MDQNQFESGTKNTRPTWTRPAIAIISLKAAKAGGASPNPHDAVQSRS